MKILLTERLSDIIYHFTTIPNLYKIIHNDEFLLSSSYEKAAETEYNQGYYLSCTRTKFSKFGYSRNRNVRITLDGQKLNQHFGGRAINYWGASMGKNYVMKNISYNPTKEYILRGDDNVMSNVENEDRVFSNEPTIPNPLNYILRIDILRSEDFIYNDEADKKDIAQIRYILTNTNNLVFVYDNDDDFNKQSNNIVNEEYLNANVNRNDLKTNNWYRDASDLLAPLLYAILVCDVQTDEWDKYTAEILKKTNLKEFIRPIITKKKVYRQSYLDVIKSYTWINALRDMHEYCPDVYKNFSPYFVSYMKKNGFIKPRDLRDYKDNISKGNDNIDTESTKILYTFENSYGDLYVIPDFQKALVRDYPKLFSVRNIFDGIERDLDYEEISFNSNKSYNRNSFLAYVKHLLYSKKGTFPNVLDLLYNLYGSNQERIDELLDGKIKPKSLNYYQALYDCKNPYIWDSKEYNAYKNELAKNFLKKDYKKVQIFESNKTIKITENQKKRLLKDKKLEET